MIEGFIVCMAIGIFCIVIGYTIWKKQKISLIHDYHYKHVKKEDVPVYCRRMGTGLLIIGAGCCLTGILNIALQTNAGWIAFAAGFIAGIVLMIKAQKKFNRE